MNLQPVDFKAVAAQGWYVYCYLRHSDSKTGPAGSPYYVGLGSTRIRACWGPHGKTPVPANKALVRVLRSGLTKEEAGQWEQFYIDHYGRKMDGGILLNQRLGGETGGAGWKASDETRAKMSAARKGKKLSAQHRANLSDSAKQKDLTKSFHSAASQAKAAKSRTGRTVTQAACEAISLAKAERKASACGLSASEWMALGDEGVRAAYFKRYQAGIRDSALLLCDRSVRIDVICIAQEMEIEPLVYANMEQADRKNLRRRFRNGKRGAALFAAA